MPSWRNNAPAIIAGTVTVASVLYPFAVYFGRDKIAPLGFVAVALAVIALRLATSSSPAARLWRLPMATAALALIGLALLDRGLAAKAYPVFLSLAVAFMFGWSLLRPPSLVERFARATRPNLPVSARVYCRNVTIVWTAWLVINAATAAALANWGSLELWTIWTGVIFYAVTAVLFVGEWGIRQWVLKAETGS